MKRFNLTVNTLVLTQGAVQSPQPRTVLGQLPTPSGKSQPKSTRPSLGKPIEQTNFTSASPSHSLGKF
ncbi:hypothetical protein DM01DRAFT_305390 [Hesseltinella vesiculosa]|uniref:Uncharacterized protein n=1 Tax=Hesseltinella vesiculosa TaxID=101127 RepID=A0A1X2GRW2_9FUNG|nr:hypothetical protein DM01DRAFT_305390 [Hesseltinella vesiculosa]